MSASPGSLLNNLLLFGRLLRSLGLDVDAGRMIDLAQALALVQIGAKEDFYHTLRCLLVHRREDILLFDQAFALFWRQPIEGPGALAVSTEGEVRRRSRRPAVVAPPLRPTEHAAEAKNRPGQTHSDEPPIVQATLTYSDREVLRRKDFGDLSPEELEAVRRMLAGLVWQLGKRRTRRFHPGQGPLFDLRRTLRQNLQYGGEALEWSRKEPKFKPRPLVIIADVSGSMERYTRLLLHFAYGLLAHSRGTASYSRGITSLQSRCAPTSGEAFVFSTRLTRITRPLRERDVDQALRQVSQSVPDWSGGTRIGEALKTFNFEWGRRVLGHGAVVLLISDGWDRGDPQELQREIARLQRSAYRLIWLNPLLGSVNYEPLTRGMQAALPYVDDFLPVHNLASLEELAAHLQRIDEFRPVRRQVKRVFTAHLPRV